MAAPLDPRPPNRSPDRIERLIGDVLRDQPLRPAPRTLPARVLAEIERRATAPWWHHSFLHWPLAVRMIFILASLGVVKLVLTGVVMLISRVHSPVVDTIAKPLSWAETSADLFSKTVGFAAVVLNAIPSTWLYAAIGLALTLYFALFVLGATAYRALYVNK
jgi:hypothetical protein